ncbi:TrkA family potassium uptake protein [Candidatus Micrarchaeota archaeon]|nr:TrkA family potassium uptake protein [Candidatus Micrarchaeota archaeon]
MKIVVFGGGKVGRALLMSLGKKHKITIIDRNRESCNIIAAESSANVICGDATDPDLLEELKISDADYVFAVTGSEETNFLVSVYAKHVNAKKVISRASDMKYSSLMERLGVEPLVPEQTLARELANIVQNPLISLMMDPRDSNIEMLEKEVKGGMENKTVGEVQEKNDFTIISVYNQGKFLFPRSDFRLKEGMKIVIVKHNA